MKRGQASLETNKQMKMEDGASASVITCSVCSNTVKDLALLEKCGHTFCSPCLLKVQRLPDSKDVCPKCGNGSLANPTAGSTVSTIGEFCPHVVSTSKESCTHCGNEFCSICMVSHLVRIKLETQWLSSSFDPRLRKVMETLEMTATRLKALVACQMADARAQIEREADTLIDKIRQRKAESLETVTIMQKNEIAAIDLLLDTTSKKVMDEKNAFVVELQNSLKTSVLLSSSSDVLDLNDDAVIIDNRINVLEHLENYSFQCEVAFGDSEPGPMTLTCSGGPQEPSFEAKSTEEGRLITALNGGNVADLKEHFQRPCIPKEAIAFAVERQDRNGQTALLLAAAKGNVDMVRYLVEECKANIWHSDSTMSGDLAIHVASRCNHVEVVTYLLGHEGSLLKSRNRLGYSPLMVAVEWGSFSLVKYLVEIQKDDVSQRYPDRYTILSMAVKKNDLVMVTYLAEKSLCKSDALLPQTRESIFHVAVNNESTAVLIYLVPKFPVLKEHRNSTGRTPLLVAFQAGYLDGFRILAQYDPSKVYMEPYLLHRAAGYGHVDIGQLLIEIYGYDAMEYDQSGKAPIHCAVHKGNLAFVKMLLNNKAEAATQPTLSSPIQTPLTIARRRGRKEIEQLLNDI